jgi:hypothetical protein
MHLAAPATGLTQDHPALRTDQPARHDLSRATGALTRQRFFCRGRLVDLHTNAVEDDREAEDKNQEHTTSHRLRKCPNGHFLLSLTGFQIGVHFFLPASRFGRLIMSFLKKIVGYVIPYKEAMQVLKINFRAKPRKKL